MKSAETWLRFGLEQYPKDADMLILAAKFEQARGDVNRAADYYRASLDAMPAADPGAQLATELSRPVPASYTGLPGKGKGAGQDLATLLAPGADSSSGTPAQALPPAETSSKPYLPSYGANAPVQLGVPYTPADPSNPGNPAPGNVVPSYMTPPASAPRTPPPAAPRTKLKDYVPQAALDQPLPPDATALPQSVVAQNFDSTALVLSPAVYEQQQVALASQQAQQSIRPGPLTSQPASQPASQQAAQPAPQQAQPQQPQPQKPVQNTTTNTTVDPVTGEVYGPYVPYTGPTPAPVQPVQLGTTPPVHNLPVPTVTDVLPTAKNVPNVKSRSTTSSHPDINAANAAAIRRQQSNPPATGQSQPPSEDIVVSNPADYNAAPQTSPQVAQPGTQQSPTGTYGQQYPQPNTRSAPPARTAPTHVRRPIRTPAPAAAVADQPAPRTGRLPRPASAIPA